MNRSPSRRTTLDVRHTVLCLGLLLLLSATGCRMVKTAVDVPVRAVTPGKKHAVDPVEMQQRLCRLTDEFSTRMIVGIEKLKRGTNVLDHAQVLQWKIAFSTETTAIASGPNAVVALLDLTVFVSVTRAALEDYWQPRFFGDSAQFMVEGCRDVETNLWQIAGTLLTPEQQAELRQAAVTWHQNNPLPESVLAARAVGLAAQVVGPASTKVATSSAKTESVFNFLSLDPLSGLDPAVREITQTRLFAERALFVTQKMPMLLRWQTELLTLNTTELPAVQSLITNSAQIADSVGRFAGVAEKLPGQISAEREAILKALQVQEKNLTPLVNEVHQTLTAGAQMSTSLNTTLTSFDALMKRFGVGETNDAGPAKTNSEPFRIRDYTETAAQLEGTARRLTELLVTFDQTLGSSNLSGLSAQFGPVVQQTQAGGRRLVNYAFWKGVLFVAIVLVACLIYRFVGARLAPSTPNKTNPP